jgi:excinuclease ABC subunit C
VVRNIRDDGARYFGPYHSATSCRETLRTVNRYFQLRTCTDHVLATRKRPCLQYQIKRCPGPCAFAVPEAEYADQVEDVMMFLAGKNDQLVSRLRSRMELRSGEQNYEAAAQLRDSIYAVEKTLARQNIVQEAFVDQDVFGLDREATVVEVVVLFIRGGKLVGRRTFRQTDQEFADSQVMANFVQQYYATGTLIPDEILVPTELEDGEVIREWLGEQRGRAVKILAPRRGNRARLIELATKNAAAAAASRSNRAEDARIALARMVDRLRLRRVPEVIECFDIAHIQGTDPVASRVLFRDGMPENASYRHFKIKTATNDDFAAMYEVVKRRFARAGDAEPGDPWALPDLLVIDGGKGQLSSALAALADLGIPTAGEAAIDVIGLAKERRAGGRPDKPERVFLRNIKEPLVLKANSTELFLLAQIRDEAHRFANTFHRKQRKKTRLRSALDDVPGIGETRRRELLKHFGSLRAIKAATVDELAAVKSMTRSAAEAVHGHFAR